MTGEAPSWGTAVHATPPEEFAGGVETCVVNGNANSQRELGEAQNARKRRIQAAGIEYEYEPLQAQQAAKPKKIKFTS